jgi:hypothetical protein
MKHDMQRGSRACTTASLSASSALVASSRSSTRGCRMMARAIAMRAFSPPLSCTPPPLPSCARRTSSQAWSSLELPAHLVMSARAGAEQRDTRRVCNGLAIVACL